MLEAGEELVSVRVAEGKELVHAEPESVVGRLPVAVELPESKSSLIGAGRRGMHVCAAGSAHSGQ